MNSDFKQPGTTPTFTGQSPMQREGEPFRASHDAPTGRPPMPDANRLKKDGVALKDKAIDRLTSEADSRKGMVSDQLKSVSSALGAAQDGLSNQEGEAPEWLKSGLRQVATTVEQLADRVQNKGSAELIGDVRSFAQNNPGTFLMACAAVGFAAARVFKASGPDTGSEATFAGSSPDSFAGRSPQPSSLGSTATRSQL